MKNYHRFDEIQKDLLEEKITCQSLVQYYLDNIEQHKDLNAFIEVYENEAIEKAKEIDSKIKHNMAGKLAGLIFGIKDLLCYANHEVQGASKILEGYESPFTATAVQKLLDEDAILIGRQNCDEFGMGSSNENSALGAVKNGLDVSKVPGGSSGGSAVAVQMDMCQISLGTDTGGSVRQPASFCGIVGLKPTYSRISRWGLLAYASSFDTIGIFSKSIEDNALIYQTISGNDEMDATSSSQKIELKFELQATPKVATLKEVIEHEGLDTEVAQKFEEFKSLLNRNGLEVATEEFPLLDYVLPTYYILTSAEASTNLSRYDGVHFGKRTKNFTNLEELYKNSRTEGFGDEVRRRILLGTFVLSADYYDAYFTKAQKARTLLIEAINKLFNKYDFIITPTASTTAFSLGEHKGNPLAMYLSDLFTVLPSVTGIPSISVPIGNDKDGMPIGLQIMARSFQEAKLFAFSKLIKEYQ